jgi:hypothetical protein
MRSRCAGLHLRAECRPSRGKRRGYKETTAALVSLLRSTLFHLLSTFVLLRIPYLPTSLLPCSTLYCKRPAKLLGAKLGTRVPETTTPA